MPTLIRTRPTLEVSVDFATNPTATFADIHSTDDGAVSFYRCNSTSTFLDERGNNDGTLISTPATIAGPYTYDSDLGLTFDGASDSAYVLDSPTIATSGACSVDGWVRVSSLPGSTKDLVCKQGAWRLQLDSTGHLVWTLQSGTSTASVTSNSVLATNTWYYVAAVYDGASGLIYLNGVLDNSVAYSSGLGVQGQPIRFAGSAAQTAPTWQSSTTNNGSSTSITGTAPASIASGDLLIAHFGISVATIQTDAVPTGWVLRDSQLMDIGDTLSEVYTKIATGAEPGSYTWTMSDSGVWACAITRITGQDTISPIETVSGTTQTANTPTHANTAQLGDTENNMVFACFYGRGGVTWTASSGTERYEYAVTNSIAGYTQTQATPSSIAVTGTSSSNVRGSAHQMIIVGSGVNETACSLDDWTYWSRALDEFDVARNYYSKDSGTSVWTAVTTEVRNLEASLPERRNELDRLVAGKMGMVLREVDDKDFDPGNTSSPYGPDVEQRVRVRATWNAVTYDVFKGYADRWTPVRLGGADVEEVQFDATDGFDLLSLAPVSGTIAAGFSGTQIDTILDKALWPVSDRAIDTGQYAMNGYTIGDGTFALALLQEVADSERGVFFIDAAGVATFHDAAHRGSQARSITSQATFADYISNIATSTDIRYQFIQPTRDKDKIINIWTVSPDSGVFGAADQTVADSISRAKYGPRGASRSTRLATNADALDQAGNLLNDTANPSDRYESMLVIPLTTESYATCLDLRISDLVTVKRGFNPGWDGATMTRNYFVEGKTVSIADKTAAWQFTFVLSPVSSGNYFGAVFRDDPISYWRNDSIT